MTTPRICTCFGFTADDLRRVALERGIASSDELTSATSAGGGCRTCVPDLARLLEELWKEKSPPRASEASRGEFVVRDAIRPFLRNGAWDLLVMDVDAASVRIRAVPRREACAEAEETLRVFVEKRLQDMYRPDAAVIFV